MHIHAITAATINHAFQLSELHSALDTSFAADARAEQREVTVPPLSRVLFSSSSHVTGSGCFPLTLRLVLGSLRHHRHSVVTVRREQQRRSLACGKTAGTTLHRISQRSDRGARLHRLGSRKEFMQAPETGPQSYCNCPWLSSPSASASKQMRAPHLSLFEFPA
jgi:hypothetical protein